MQCDIGVHLEIVALIYTAGFLLILRICFVHVGKPSKWHNEEADSSSSVMLKTSLGDSQTQQSTDCKLGISLKLFQQVTLAAFLRILNLYAFYKEYNIYIWV